MLYYSHMATLLSISETAELLGVSMDTLRRWDAKGMLPSVRAGARGHRYYRLEDIQKYRNDPSLLAQNWVSHNIPEEPEADYYCQTTAIFQARLEKMGAEMEKKPPLQSEFSLLTAITGEIGNNSFDHNLGNWPDIPGIFFTYDLNKKMIVLADRGQGILTTLKRILPTLETDTEALSIAFTEILSGRAPENRGNGLKFVKSVIQNSPAINLQFQSGNGKINITPKKLNLETTIETKSIRGCLAIIHF